MSFADIGVSGRVTTKDGQQFFDVKKIKIDSIFNLPIKVEKFQTDVKTQHGNGRYVVLIEYNGEKCKFITNSFTLKNMLDQAAKIENAFPISTVIKKRDIGGKFPDYYFE